MLQYSAFKEGHFWPIPYFTEYKSHQSRKVSCRRKKKCYIFILEMYFTKAKTQLNRCWVQ